MAAAKGNKYNEKYTKKIALELFENALKILLEDEEIITETELAFRCKYALSLPYSSYCYLRDIKFKKELGDIKKEIDSTLETRVMKSKKMYPGIVAMTLKNKHGWRDQQQLPGADGKSFEIKLNVELKTLVDDIVGERK